MRNYLGGFLKNKKKISYTERHVADIVRHRKPFIENALKNALIRHLSKEDF